MMCVYMHVIEAYFEEVMDLATIAVVFKPSLTIEILITVVSYLTQPNPCPYHVTNCFSWFHQSEATFEKCII